MQHIDDGALHAYLDGALDALGAGEARRVRAHLDACAACARRLEEERAVRAEAEAILGEAAPQVVAPPLEELQGEARRRSAAARGLSRRYRVAWAASVVLALGTGWMLRDQIGEWVFRSDSLQQARPSVSEAADGRPAGRAGEAGSESMSGPASPSGAGEEAGSEPPTQQVPAEDAAGEMSTAEGDRRGAPARETSTEGETAGATAGKSPPVLSEGEAAAARAALSDAPPTAGGVVEGAQVSDEAGAADAAPAPAAAAKVPTPAVGEGAAAADEVVSDASVPSIPGLEVLETERLTTREGGVAIRVRQRTPEGELLHLYLLPAGVAPTSAARFDASADPMRRAAAEGEVDRRREEGAAVLEVRRPYRGGWAVLRGRLPSETLEQYLALLVGNE